MIHTVTTEDRWSEFDDDALLDEVTTYTHAPIPQVPPLGLVIETTRRLRQHSTHLNPPSPRTAPPEEALVGTASDSVLHEAGIPLSPGSAMVSLDDPGLTDAEFAALARALFAERGWLPARIVESALHRLTVRCWAHLAPGVEPSVLARVLDAIPVGLDPMEVEGFLSTPNPNLIIDDRIVNIAEFLAAGGETEIVVQLAQDLDRW